MERQRASTGCDPANLKLFAQVEAGVRWALNPGLAIKLIGGWVHLHIKAIALIAWIFPFAGNHFMFSAS
ncbi:MAG: hypothetical protein MUQ10_03125 [Anaerolineae bacterium]|nr:hypothetical protein [Anaerolineae bacterium]